MQLVGALLDANDLLGNQVELARILADVAQKRHRALYQFRACERVLAHLLHLPLEAVHLEQRDGLGGLVHLVDRVVERADQVLDVAAVERRDEGAADGDQHLAGDLVRLIFQREDLRAAVLDRVAALQETAQRLGARDDKSGMLLKEVKELVLLGHDRLEPAEHECLASQIAAPTER